MRIRKGHNGIKRIQRPNSPGRVQQIDNFYDIYTIEAKIHKNAQERDKNIKHFDERYGIVVTLFMNEITRRKIDITSTEFDEKMEEILQRIFQGKFFQTRFPNENLNDVRNTVLRAVNEKRREIDKKNTEKGRDDE